MGIRRRLLEEAGGWDPPALLRAGSVPLTRSRTGTVLIFHDIPQGIDGIHSFCTKALGFLLDARAWLAQSG
jgi:hypothetical protein